MLVKGFLTCLVFASLLLSSCGSSSVNAIPAVPSTASRHDTAATLQRIVDEGWADVAKGRADFRGSLVLHIESTAGDYTVSSGDPIEDPANGNLRVASNTKNFTAAAIMLLAQEGQLNIDDPVGNYLPDTADYQIPNRDTITLRQILQHRGGVFDLTNTVVPSDVAQPYAGQNYPDYIFGLPGNGEHTLTFDEMFGVVSTNQLSQFPPGAKYQYSNGGFSLLAKVVEHVSGLRYDQFLQERFFAPHGLAHTRAPYLGSDQTIDAPFLRGYGYFPPPDGLIDVTATNQSSLVGAGNLISNARELALWYRLLFTGGLGLSSETVNEMMDVQPTGETLRFYGLGVTYTPGLGYGHDGTLLGSVSTCRYDPSSDTLVIIYCTNLDAADIAGNVFALYDIAAAAKGLLEGRVIDTSDFRSGLPAN
jgi:D-alanyl-D-alanine carboxypeptidase